MSKDTLIALAFLVLPTTAIAENKRDVVDKNAFMLMSPLSLMETCANTIGEPYAGRRNSLESKLRELVDVAGFDTEAFWKTYRKKIDAYQMVDSAGVRSEMTADELKEFRSNCEMYERSAGHDESSVSDAIRKLRQGTSPSRRKSNS